MQFWLIIEEFNFMIDLINMADLIIVLVITFTSIYSINKVRMEEGTTIYAM